MEVCGSSNVSLREFGCEQSLLSRPDGSASFIQGEDTWRDVSVSAVEGSSGSVYFTPRSSHVGLSAVYCSLNAA